MTGDYKFATNSIHGGAKEKNAKNALNPPIYQTSTFLFDSLDHVDKVMSFESDDYVYTRGNNPTLRLFEDRMALLEGGVGAVAFSSGMAAISSVMFSFLKPGDNIILHKTIYGTSYDMATKLLPDYNVEYKITDLTDPTSLESVIDENTKLLYFESPSNPDLSIVDIERVADIARKKGVKVVVDNTFASPYFQNPLKLGADVVVHSATKYISGHGDVIGGVAVAKDEKYLDSLRFEYMSEFGGVMSPFNGWLLLRGLKTLKIRMKEHESNAIKVAEFLNNHPRVKTTMYPGLPDFKGHDIARKQMRGFGAMIAFELDGNLEETKKFIDSVKLTQLAVSLGDCETLIEVPSLMTHRGFPKDKLKDFGLTEGMIRLSVGLEDAEDIIKDLKDALENL